MFKKVSCAFSLMASLSFSLLALPSAGEIDAQENIAKKVPQAKKVLDKWQAQDAVEGKRVLHVVYWSPADRSPQAGYRQRLSDIMLDIQGFYGGQMKRLGFGELSINLDLEEDELLKIHLVSGSKPYSYYDGASGSELRKDCVKVLAKEGIDANKETILIFCNMSNWDKESRKINQNSPYYAYGFHAGGTAWQVDSAILELDQLANKAGFVRDGQYGRISMGKYNSIFIGGIAHELGHALGLPHNKACPWEAKDFGVALMGSGNRAYGSDLRGEGKGAFLSLAHGMRLASHPMFSGSIKGIRSQVKFEVSDVKFQDREKAFTYTASLKSEIPAHAVIGYIDPLGGSNYDASAIVAVPDKEGRFTLNCNVLTPGKAAELRIVPLFANGDASSHSSWSNRDIVYPFNVKRDGRVDIAEVQTVMAIEPLLVAFRSRDHLEVKRLSEILAKSKNKKLQDLSKNLLKEGFDYSSPEAVTRDVEEVALSACKPSAAKVGWLEPSYNRVPSRDLILKAGGKIYSHGLFAHAPAEHVYKLAKDWSKLTGFCGVADSARGTVVFIIKGDGKELWRSRRMKAPAIAKYSVDLSGVSELSLEVQDAGDGNRSDWGLWLEPILQR